MQPTRIQLFYARNWPMKLWFVIAPPALGLVFARTYGLRWVEFPEPRAFGIASMCFTLGLLVSAATGWFVLGPLYYARGMMNGAPYQVGDEVLILADRKIARVAELDESHDRVRVESGELYGYVQICRVNR